MVLGLSFCHMSKKSSGKMFNLFKASKFILLIIFEYVFHIHKYMVMVLCTHFRLIYLLSTCTFFRSLKSNNFGHLGKTNTTAKIHSPREVYSIRWLLMDYMPAWLFINGLEYHKFLVFKYSKNSEISVSNCYSCNSM